MGEARPRGFSDEELLEQTPGACAASPEVQKGLPASGPRCVQRREGEGRPAWA